jgi:hypothetical protein
MKRRQLSRPAALAAVAGGLVVVFAAAADVHAGPAPDLIIADLARPQAEVAPGRHPGSMAAWEIVRREVTIQLVNGRGGESADCPPGKRVLGGGLQILSPSWLTHQHIRQNGPRADGTGWVVELQDEQNESVRVVISAICGSVAP